MNTELRASLEAILLVADEPVPVVVLAQVLECPKDQVALELSQLAAAYTEECRGFDLREIAGGWRYYTREEYAPVVERFVQDGRSGFQGVPVVTGESLLVRVVGHAGENW